jgi:hypothetical protein
MFSSAVFLLGGIVIVVPSAFRLSYDVLINLGRSDAWVLVLSGAGVNVVRPFPQAILCLKSRCCLLLDGRWCSISYGLRGILVLNRRWFSISLAVIHVQIACYRPFNWKTHVLLQTRQLYSTTIGGEGQGTGSVPFHRSRCQSERKYFFHKFMMCILRVKNTAVG